METLIGRKALQKHGSTMRESVSAPVSDFARRQMLKMGWVEGKGLGKNEDGMLSHLRAEKREEAAGLGSENLTKEEAAAKEGWWFDAFSSNLKMFKKAFKSDSDNDDDDKAKKDKKKKKKKDKDKNKAESKEEAKKSKGGDMEKEEGDSKKKKKKEKDRTKDHEEAKKSEKKSKSKKRARDNADSDDASEDRPSFDDLFKATGGARLGMRARANQKGKFLRTENV